MVNHVVNWWNTSCWVCLKIRWIFLELFNLLSVAILIGIFIFAGLGVYWLWWDTDPIIYYGPNGRVEFVGNNIIFHIDGVRLRDCPAKVRRKIVGCGQIDIQETDALTPIGQRVPPISIPMNRLLQSFSREQLSGNVCSMVSVLEGYCNPAQVFFNMPIRTESPPITFIPVPRSKSYAEPNPEGAGSQK